MAAEHDVDLLVRDAFFPNTKAGTIVEVGAARPDYLSISSTFRHLGWSVIAIEPNPEFCAAHRSAGYDVLEYAISDTEADDVPFYLVDQITRPDYIDGNVSFESFSSLGIVHPDIAAAFDTVKDRTKTRTVYVKVRKLDTVLALHAPELRTIDLLTVDVEGWELNVMRGLSLDRYRPKVVILENLTDDTSYMRERGYDLWKRLLPNDVYVRRS